MDISRAHTQIVGAVKAYLSRDEHGLYRIPFHMQRPIIMFGPPGVGKTAIVAQIAEELGINFVAYSITHHTRQSALGLPFITTKTYGGKEYAVSEYTMSEIIGSAYDAIEESGVSEGILFLDEVNCVSETLAPAMLQFLQYKTFGQHRLPEGWVIVCAGNPPEYNRSAREFDPVTMDRLKRIDVEPDVDVWLAYAAERNLHPAVVTYLQTKPGAFYKVQAGVRGSLMVTARGWEDLSRIIGAFEAEGLVVDRDLIGQYLQDPDTADGFAVYYRLFRKYRDDYKIPGILAGEVDDAVRARAAAAPFDERTVLVGLISEALRSRIHNSMALEEALRRVRGEVSDFCHRGLSGEDAATFFAKRIAEVQAAPDAGKKTSADVGERQIIRAEQLRLLESFRVCAAAAASEPDASPESIAREVKAAYNAEALRQADLAKSCSFALDAAFRFLDSALEDGEEPLLLVTKLSGDATVVKHVAEHGSREFLGHSKSLMFSQRNLELLKDVDALKD